MDEPVFYMQPPARHSAWTREGALLVWGVACSTGKRLLEGGGIGIDESVGGDMCCERGWHAGPEVKASLWMLS